MAASLQLSLWSGSSEGGPACIPLVPLLLGRTAVVSQREVGLKVGKQHCELSWQLWCKAVLLIRSTLVLNFLLVSVRRDRSVPVWGDCNPASQLVELISPGSCWPLSYLCGLLGFCPQICPSYNQKSCVLASSPRGRGKRVWFVTLGRKKLFDYFSVDSYLIVVETYNIIALYFKRLVFFTFSLTMFLNAIKSF